MSDRLAEGYIVVIIDARINEARQANDASLDDKRDYSLILTQCRPISSNVASSFNLGILKPKDTKQIQHIQRMKHIKQPTQPSSAHPDVEKIIHFGRMRNR